MTDLNPFKVINNEESCEIEPNEVFGTNKENRNEDKMQENSEESNKTNFEVPEMPNEELSRRLITDSTFEKNSLSFSYIENIQKVLEDSKKDQVIQEKPQDKQGIDVKVDSVPENLSEKIAQLDSLPSVKPVENVIYSAAKTKCSSTPVKRITLVEAYSDSSESTDSETQIAASSFETSWTSQDNINSNRINFENAIESQPIWKETSDTLSDSAVEMKMVVESTEAVEPVEPAPQPVLPPEPVEPQVEQSENKSPSDIPVITIDENTQPSAPANEVTSAENSTSTFLTPCTFPPPPPSDQSSTIKTDSENTVETIQPQPPPEPIPVPVPPPAPRKRGRPRKQVLPNPSPLVESWGPNAQEFPSIDTQKEERKRSVRAERRQSKKKKLEDEETDENSTRKRRTSQVTPKKKRRSTYVPKKKLPPQKKKQSEIENFQNFEEETRMSASEGPAGFSSRTGAAGDESQGSSATTDGPTRSNINKKGRMEVGTDGCKPVTVSQIVEYCWPPPSSGEKPEGLMIQEQVCEYLGVKSFKRKYPSIKRRPVDMEERNYLQENGYVSENMCDMGLTAVFAADIIEIMYNDFPHKFDEYRKYTREKKAREQRALREKQAAERADLDPKKEAVESTLSWNSEFNKTRRFRVVNRYPNQRFQTEGIPVPANERVVFMHAPDNFALCVENEYWKMTMFSYECEISAHTKVDQNRQHMNENLWVVSVGTL